MSIAEVIADVAANKAMDKLSFSEFTVDLSTPQQLELASALEKNSTIKTLHLENKGIGTDGANAIIQALAGNSTITNLDLGYNQLKAAHVIALGQILATNKSITEVKIHRQAEDYGPAAEKELVQLWSTNTTLTRLYATLHDRNANNTNTKAEVRNKEIANRIKLGKPWNDLDPDPTVKAAYLAQQEEEKAAKKAAESAANAPITAKIASTGGPYTYKELTCAAEFRPDDVDQANREMSLNDEEFQEKFGMDKAAWGGLAGWKKAGAKKKVNLH